MKNNTKAFLICVLAIAMAAAIAAGCTPKDDMENIVEMEPADPADFVEEDVIEMEMAMTLDELKAFDGTNGNPAYIAYEGVIYDVTGVSEWSSGKHGGNMVGTDITEKLNNAPHGTSKLSGLDEVGKVID